MPREPSHSGASSSSRSVTMRAVGFGTSTPTAPLPGNRRHADRRRAHRHGQVVGQRHDPPRLHARRRHHLELGHHRARGAARDRALHLEGPQCLQQQRAEPVELRVARGRCPGWRRGVSRSIGGSSSSSVMLAGRVLRRRLRLLLLLRAARGWDAAGAMTSSSSSHRCSPRPPRRGPGARPPSASGRPSRRGRQARHGRRRSRPSPAAAADATRASPG